MGGSLLLTALGSLVALPAWTHAAERIYFIAAEEMEWDYCRGQDRDQMSGTLFAEHAHAATFTEASAERIGCQYLKARYVRYTDATFTQRWTVPPEEQHLALLGPTIRAEVGDTLRVHFANRASFPVSIHAHGVEYTRSHEGMPDYQQEPKDMADDAVAPGGNYTYLWDVPEWSGPLPEQPSSIVWLYHDHADEVAGPYAGLVGNLIITRKGWADSQARPLDVDRELLLFFSVMNEGGSRLLNANVQHYLNATGNLTQSALDHLLKDGDFQESNLMHAVNGRMYGVLEGMSVKQHQRVRWHLVSLGTEVDLHSAHWHGNTVVHMGRRTDNIELLPASMHTADMVADNAGRWFTECHVADHVLGGMFLFYNVQPCAQQCSSATVPALAAPQGSASGSGLHAHATRGDTLGLAIAVGVLGTMTAALLAVVVRLARRAPMVAPGKVGVATGDVESATA